VIDPVHTFSVRAVLREHRRSHPRGVAAICGDDRFTYPELDRRTSRLANALLARGIGAGDRMLWLGQNCHRLLEAFLAAAKIGAAICPANWRQSPDELEAIIRDLDPKLIFWQAAEVGETIGKARALSPNRALWVQHDAPSSEAAGYEALLGGAPDSEIDASVDPSAPLLIQYTAAFQGRPMGALISHEALLVQGLVTSKLRSIESDYVYLNSGPLFHMATFVTTFATFLFAGTNVFIRRPDPEEIARTIDRHRCTGAFLMPPTMNEIAVLNKDARYDLSSLRSYKGSPEWNRMVRLDDSLAAQKPGGYGQTEVGGHLTFGAFGIGAEGASGRPMPLVEVRIVDPDGREVESGEIGEIVACGPTIMLGYHARPEETARRRAGGWHHTRDLGRREADGSLTFVGPMARIIKSAAENIYPVEVESCLLKHPAVKDCAVIGVPDPKWGQSVKAIVVFKDGARAAEDELIEHVRSRIASYKKPRSIEIAEAIPRKGPVIDYEALDRRFGGGGYPGER
jgi:acyl-CoA synthetase (AMP-forming)/AMP-acid ligase II